MMTKEIKVQSSSGNVFADMGLQNPEELLIKAELVRQISKIIAARKITARKSNTNTRNRSTKSFGSLKW